VTVKRRGVGIEVCENYHYFWHVAPARVAGGSATANFVYQLRAKISIFYPS
jgi:hypothetical protein